MLKIKEIRGKIKIETGLTASAGISINKFLSKIASDWNKPDGQKTLPPGEVSNFLESLDVKKFHGIGKDDKSATENCFDGKMSQTYFIDGLALGPEYFGLTDPLTNTWKPKKFKAEGTTYNDGTVWSSGSTVTGGSISNAADSIQSTVFVYPITPSTFVS